MKEEWRTTTVDDKYEVSMLGRVRVKKTLHIMKPQKSNSQRRVDQGYNQYLNIGLMIDGKQKNFYIHRLVALAFVPNPENKPQVDHINADHQDNWFTNLRWCTAAENLKWKMENKHGKENN